jgi:glycosyltransferase involved in cell wall biosynthesis
MTVMVVEPAALLPVNAAAISASGVMRPVNEYSGPLMQSNRADRVWVVIAAYNEAKVIARVLADVQRRGFHVVLVDDGSLDGTPEIASKTGAVVVRHPVNLGQGAALQTGIAFALRAGAEFVVTFDADGQHRAAEIVNMVDALEANDADFALGSRFLGTTVDLPLARRLLLKAATWFTSFTTGLRVTDTHNGFRAMTRRGAACVRLRQNRMAHASEFLDQVARSGLRYVEVPVTIEYSAYSLAKGQKLSDALSILVDLSAQRLQR